MDIFETNSHMLYKSRAFNNRPEDPYIYTSKKIGPIYIQCAELQNYPVLLEEALGDIKEMILSVIDIDKIDRITGGELRDLVFSIPLALRMGKPHTIIRKKETGHGTGGNLITTIKPGEYVVHVPDLRTTGKSEIRYWIPAIREADGNIEHSFAYFDRIQSGDTLDKLDPPVTGHSVVQMSDRFFELGIDGNYMTKADYDELKSYLSDADGWARNFLKNHPGFLTRHADDAEEILAQYPGLEI